jgi:DNA-binding protein HU-beta
MNKSELIKAVTHLLGGTAKEGTAATEAVLEAMHAGITAGGLELQGFGNFAIKHRAARTGRNPRTGAALEIAAKNVVDFNPSSKLKAAVNE